MKKCAYILLVIATGLGIPTNSVASGSYGVFRVSAIADQVAVGGKPFVFSLPSDAFGGNTYATYSATWSGHPWLSFDPSPGVLEFSGQPTNSDVSSFLVEVTGSTGSVSETQTFIITVQAAPTVDLNPDPTLQDHNTDFFEGDPPVEVVDYLDISDLDGTHLSAATVTLIAPIAGEEELTISAADIAAAASVGINVERNISTGAIQLTGTSARPNATFAEYESVLRDIFYANDSEDPTAGTRVIIVQVWDSEGNVSNGVPSFVNVIPINDPPTLDIDTDDNNNDGAAEFSNTFVEDGPAVVITDSDVEITDVDHDGFAQIVASITNRIDGDLEYLSVTGGLPGGLSFGYSISEDLVISGSGSLSDFETALKRITYQNDSQDPDDTPRNVRITYNDLGTNGAVSNNTTIYVVPKNDPPDDHVDTLIVAEYSQDNPFTLPPPSDVDNTLEELEMIVSALPDLGVVTRADGRPVAVGDRLPATAFTTLQYDTPDNYDGQTPPGRFVYTVEDDSAATATSTVTFLINNAPEADDFTVTTAEDVEYVFTLADFADGYFDAEGDTLAFIVVNSLPLDGWLLLEGDTVRINDELRLTALDSGKLLYAPPLNGNGDPYTSFLFRVKDERQAISEPYVASIVVTPVSDPPSVDTVRVSGPENETIRFSADDFKAQFSDPEGDPLTKVRIERLPTNGTLLFKDQPVVVGDELPVGQLDSLAFVPNAGFDGTTQFLWNGHDGSAYAERPAPTIINILEDNTLSAIDGEIRMEDILVYTGSLLPNVVNPANGALAFTTSPVVATEHGTLTIEPDGTFTYETTDDFSGTDAFTFEVCNTATPVQCAQATITIVVINGRLDSDRDGIPDAEEDPLVIYEGFSPDGDGINDVWRVRSIENYPNNTVRIFNRWGNLVFEITGYNNQDRAWSSHSTAGLVTGDVPDGTYFYLIDLGNNQPPRSGYVIVNR